MFQFEEITATSRKPIPTLNAEMVCDRFEISVKTLWRWQNHPALAFPEPLYFQGRRYWPEGEIVDWETRTLGITVVVGNETKRPHLDRWDKHPCLSALPNQQTLSRFQH